MATATGVERGLPTPAPRSLKKLRRELVACGDAPRRIAEAAPRIRKAIARQTLDAARWRRLLERAARQACDKPCRSADALVLAELLMALKAWSPARRLLRAWIERHSECEAALLAALARCEQRTGHGALALAIARSIPQQAMEDTELKEEVARWEAKLARCDEGWRKPLRSRRHRLYLEPLDTEHAEDFLHQYRDPRIREMTLMPRFQTRDDVYEWIEGHMRRPRRWRYCVVHESKGLVAYVSANPIGRCASFGFWSGADHRGQGWASRAGEVLIRHLFERGFEWMFAVVFADNRASLRALQRLGFRLLPVVCANLEGPSRSYLARSCVDDGFDLRPAIDAFRGFMAQDDPRLEFSSALQPRVRG